jgi:hypothetical protein
VRSPPETEMRDVRAMLCGSGNSRKHHQTKHGIRATTTMTTTTTAYNASK